MCIDTSGHRYPCFTWAGFLQRPAFKLSSLLERKLFNYRFSRASSPETKKDSVGRQCFISFRLKGLYKSGLEALYSFCLVTENCYASFTSAQPSSGNVPTSPSFDFLAWGKYSPTSSKSLSNVRIWSQMPMLHTCDSKHQIFATNSANPVSHFEHLNQQHFQWKTLSPWILLRLMLKTVS